MKSALQELHTLNGSGTIIKRTPMGIMDGWLVLAIVKFNR